MVLKQANCGNPGVIVLNCYGRGGSSIVWNLIGSSDEVLMPDREWHQGVFGDRRLLRKAVVSTARYIDLERFGGLGRWAFGRTLATIPKSELDLKPEAQQTVLKVMGYHARLNGVASEGFSGSKTVVLARNPVSLCESLMRGGAKLSYATNHYNGVGRELIRARSRKGALFLKFEDFLASPGTFIDDLYSALSLRRPSTNTYRVKMKPFGQARTAGVSVEGASVHVVRLEELADYIDPRADQSAIERLDRRVVDAIWGATHEVAQLLGYEQPWVASRPRRSSAL